MWWRRSKITVKSKENEKRTAAKAAVLFSFIGESLCGVIPGGRTVEHFLYHGLEGIDHRALGDISGCALDLIALKALGVIYRDSDFPMIGGDVLQGCVQKHIPHHQLALRGHVLEGDGHNVGLTVHTGSKVPQSAFQQLYGIFIQHDDFLLVFRAAGPVCCADYKPDMRAGKDMGQFMSRS